MRDKLWIERSQFQAFKARHEYGNVDPPYDASKDPAVQDELRSIEADYKDDDWWHNYYKDQAALSSIFVVEAKDEVKEGQQ